MPYGATGPNALEIQVSNTRRPAPAALSRLEIGVAGGTVEDVTSVEPDASGLVLIPDVNLPLGETDISITIVREGLLPSSAVVQTRTVAHDFHTPAVVSSRPIRQPLRIAGGLTIGVAVMLIAVGRYRARRRGGRECAHEPIVVPIP